MLIFHWKSDIELKAVLEPISVLNSVYWYQHSKFVGEDTNVGYDVTIKRDDVRYLELWQYTVYAKIGYKWINVYGAYQLQPTFKKNQGPQMYPISVGLSIMPY